MISFKDLMAMIIRKEKKCLILHLSSAKENTDKGNKLQLQHEVKRCKEAHANIYCSAWKKATENCYQMWESLPQKSQESEFSN